MSELLKFQSLSHVRFGRIHDSSRDDLHVVYCFLMRT